MEPRLKISCC